MDIPYSYTTGFSSGAGNIGAMVNKGVDLDFKVDIIQNSNFYWGFRANFNYNKNEIPSYSTDVMNIVYPTMVCNTK